MRGFHAEDGDENTLFWLVGGGIALYFLYKYSISKVATSVAADGSMASGVSVGTPSSANTPAMTPNTSNVAATPPVYSGALGLFMGYTPGNPTVTSPSTVAKSQTAFVPSSTGRVIDTTAMQTQINAQIKAGQQPGQVTYVNPSFIANASGPTKQLLLQQLAAGRITTIPPAWA